MKCLSLPWSYFSFWFRDGGTLPLLLLSLLLPLSHAHAALCGAPQGKGILRLQPSVYLALADGVVTGSPYAAGDVAPAGRVLVTQTFIQNENRQADIGERIAALQLKLLAARNQALVNRAGLDAYVERNGALSSAAALRAARQEEISILERTIAELEHNRKRQEISHQGALPQPVLLLSDPPRVAETVKAGATLFQYVYLDRLSIAVSSAAPLTEAAPAAAELFLEVGASCLRFAFLRGSVEPASHSVELIYQARIAPAYSADVARLIRSPHSYVPLFAQAMP
jgi:uncharacterized protein YqcC (DUF446 family)